MDLVLGDNILVGTKGFMQAIVFIDDDKSKVRKVR